MFKDRLWAVAVYYFIFMMIATLFKVIPLAVSSAVLALIISVLFAAVFGCLSDFLYDKDQIGATHVLAFAGIALSIWNLLSGLTYSLDSLIGRNRTEHGAYIIQNTILNLLEKIPAGVLPILANVFAITLAILCWYYNDRIDKKST